MKVTRENVIIKGPYIPPNIDGVIWVLLSPEFPTGKYREYKVLISSLDYKKQKSLHQFIALLNAKIELGIHIMNEMEDG